MVGSNCRPSRTLIRARHYPMASLFDQMNRLFDDAAPTIRCVDEAPRFRPHIDIHETEREYLIAAEFPGLDASEVSIELKDNTLVLSGEKRPSTDTIARDAKVLERGFGTFSRSIPFSIEIDEENTSADMKNGLLTIRVPKSPKVVRGPKKVPIQS